MIRISILFVGSAVLVGVLAGVAQDRAAEPYVGFKSDQALLASNESSRSAMAARTSRSPRAKRSRQRSASSRGCRFFSGAARRSWTCWAIRRPSAITANRKAKIHQARWCTSSTRASGVCNSRSASPGSTTR